MELEEMARLLMGMYQRQQAMHDALTIICSQLHQEQPELAIALTRQFQAVAAVPPPHITPALADIATRLAATLSTGEAVLMGSEKHPTPEAWRSTFRVIHQESGDTQRATTKRTPFHPPED